VHSYPPFLADNAFSMGKKTPSRRQAMQPIINIPEEDQATDIGNMHKKDRQCGSGDIPADRQTDPQTDILITILRNCSCGRSNEDSDVRNTTADA